MFALRVQCVVQIVIYNLRSRFPLGPGLLPLYRDFARSASFFQVTRDTSGQLLQSLSNPPRASGPTTPIDGMTSTATLRRDIFSFIRWFSLTNLFSSALIVLLSFLRFSFSWTTFSEFFKSLSSLAVFSLRASFSSSIRRPFRLRSLISSLREVFTSSTSSLS